MNTKKMSMSAPAGRTLRRGWFGLRGVTAPAIAALFCAAASTGTAVAAASAAGAAPQLRGGGELREVAVAGSLAETLKQIGSRERGALWFAWEVAAMPSLGNACCFDDKFRGCVCRLEGKNQSWGTRGDGDPGTGHERVLVRWAKGEVERARGLSTSCELDTGGLPLVHLAGVAPAESVALLEGLARRPAQRRHEGAEPLAALAYHAGPAAAEALHRLAAVDRSSDDREQALFWIGQARGEEGARFLAGVARNDASPDIREKAIFSLSQNDGPSAIPAIIDVAKTDRDPDVRGQALFWLAQSGAEQAPRVILARLDEDPSPEVRKKAIFAITQLEGGQDVLLLMRIARERRDPEIRREALFWLGQSSDPRAIDFFAKILGQ
ncbi:MAG TPA: HEAT repeat domain-containing protein [Thermoanaerobaculia bacterium]|nr:HEAT repeat domain-containing protein [Thermoanaerobaculia bacterium]